MNMSVSVTLCDVPALAFQCTGIQVNSYFLSCSSAVRPKVCESLPPTAVFWALRERIHPKKSDYPLSNLRL